MKLEIISVFIICFLCGKASSQSSNQGSIRSRHLQEECPEVETVPDFKVTEFINAPWYVQRQRVVPFQPAETFYCVEASYNLHPNWFYSFFNGWELEANNYGETENGEPRKATLCAKQQDENSSKLWVAPCWLPFSGPFWVVEYVEGDQGYAIISGGQPTINTGNGCKVPDGNGLWIFTRERNPSNDLIAEVLDIAKAKGFDVDLDDFLPVDHSNCIRDMH